VDDASPLAKRIKYLSNIVTAARNLLNLINSLLDMAKLEAGRVDLVLTGVSMHDACEALIGLIYPQAERKRISLKLEVALDIPIVETDLQKLQQIIFNFLSNAVKFTEGADMTGVKGGVILRAERLLGDDEGERVRISVIDNGPGIDPKDHQRIFEKFHQLDGSHTRKHTGAGLGLAISRELAAMLQGEIQVVSDIGRGSMFSLILPLKLDPDRIAEARLEGALRGTLAGFNYDPSHFGYQGVDYAGFIEQFGDRIYHVHMKDVWWSTTPKRSGVFGGHLDFGHRDRYWDFRSIGRGSIVFVEIIRALIRIGFDGPLCIEWVDSGMDREDGAEEACFYVKDVDFAPAVGAFDAAFAKDNQ
jgi:anti-sigma regulatory factor (Ser/Thr protein kinase)